ncbi:MAG TPA: AI-2E family transporter, partial [Saprospirales bacterium]|nr:AI-2E family transporter [Saprospirales bacterium]
MNQLPATPIRQVFLILLIAGIFGVLFFNLYFFVPALLGAYTLYVLLRTPLFFLTEKWKWSNKASVIVLMILSFITILLPFNWVFSLLSSRIISLFQNSDTLLVNIQNVVRKIEAQYQISLLTPENLKSISDWSVHQVQHILSATVSGLGLFVVMYFILWFMLTEGKKMEQSFFDWMPLRHENVLFVRRHLNDMVWANALGIPMMGVVQGLAGFLIYWLADVPDPWLWFAVTFVSGMMPVVGVSLAYIPLGLLLLAN